MNTTIVDTDKGSSFTHKDANNNSKNNNEKIDNGNANFNRKHRRLKVKNQDDAEVNMTPMLDIVFIMLIFFIVTSTFIRESGLDVTEHRSNEQTQKNRKSAKAIVMQICANDEIRIDHRVIDRRAVRANVERKLAEDPESVVIVETEKAAPTGLLVAVMDQAIQAGTVASIAPGEMHCRD